MLGYVLILKLTTSLNFFIEIIKHASHLLTLCVIGSSDQILNQNILVEYETVTGCRSDSVIVGHPNLPPPPSLQVPCIVIQNDA